jgi:Rieske 2Fe-2S family protein
MPGHYYTSPGIFAEEQETIFAKRWVCVGRAAEIADKGCYAAYTIAGESIIVVRGRGGDGGVRAFYNVCRHRGTRLTEERTGCYPGSIQCPYHAWTYSLDGQLIGAPHMQEVEGFDKREYPLHSVAIHEWEGLLWVNLARDPEPFEQTFAPVMGRFSRFNIPKLALIKRIEYDVASNWKLINQNYSECLHCPVIHPELSRIMPYQSGANDLVEGLQLGGYMMIGQEAGKREAGSGKREAAGASMTMTGHLAGLPVGDLPPDDMDRAYYYTLFPNLLLSMHPDYVCVYTLWPESPRRTRVICDWLFSKESVGDPAFNPGDAIEFWDRTNRQDWHITEQSLKGISSRAYVPGPYSPRESIPAAWDRAYLKVMGNGE